MVYALLLNDMRSRNIENLKIVRISENRQELVHWYESQLAGAPWKDDRWYKTFRQGSELEWFNPLGQLETDNDYWGGIWQVDDAVVGGELTKR